MKSSATRSPDRGILAEANIAFARRLAEAMEGHVASAIAKAVGIAGSTLHRYQAGSMPAADIGFRLSRALGVRPEWLIEGVGVKSPGAEVVGVGGQVTLLHRYDIFAFREEGKPEPVETIALPTAWLMQAVRSTTDLWLTNMPSDALPSLAHDGQVLICKDAEPTLQDRRVYIFLIDGRPIVRRAFVMPDGLQLRSEDPGDLVLIRPQDLEHLKPVGRVLSAIAMNTV